MSETCWFCRQSLRQSGRPIDRHHLLPKRYFLKGENRDQGNVVYAHVDCHALWHRVYDSPRLNREAYLKKMRAIQWGRGMFARRTEDALAAD